MGAKICKHVDPNKRSLEQLHGQPGQVRLEHFRFRLVKLSPFKFGIKLQPCCCSHEVSAASQSLKGKHEQSSNARLDPSRILSVRDNYTKTLE